MTNKKPKRTFFDLFKHPRPTLSVKFSVSSNEESKTVFIRNQLRQQTNFKSIAVVERLCRDSKLKDFLAFYSQYDGFDLGIPVSTYVAASKPLLSQLPGSSLEKFTRKYLPKGEWDWTIDLNKTKDLYRKGDNWIAFAEIGEGPACLTIFLEGENAGQVFLVNPQPHFNNTKPIAKSYTLLLDRIAKDPAAFFRLIRSYVRIKGDDQQFYGYLPSEYADDFRESL